MKKIFYLVLLSTYVIIFTLECTADAGIKTADSIKAVPFTDVDITDTFWNPFIERNLKISIPQMLKEYNDPNQIPDTRLIEAASYVLAKYPDEQLEKRIELLSERVANSFLSADPSQRWKNLLNGELYSAGHFFEAAVAFYQSTGNKKILEAAVKVADSIDSVFGPDKRRDVSGHEELKIGLLRLYHLTGNRKYYRLARFFLDERGYSHNGRKLHGPYAQDHMPVTKQTKAVGHCVRAMYLYNPLAEIAELSKNPAYTKASERIWEDAVSKKMYLIGNFGSHRDYEDFGDDYELPNLSCWNETCSAVGNVFWNHKLFLLNGHSKYIDVMERCLYNGFLAGVSIGGDRYFYQNVLQTIDGFERYPWFGPNCCPPNLSRLLASLGGYIYAQRGNEIFINLFVTNRAKIKLADNVFAITQQTQYPWDGVVRIKVEPQQTTECIIHLRIPCWAQNKPVPTDLYRYIDTNTEKPALEVNGRPIKITLRNGFASIKRKWKKGDVIKLDLPMPVRRVIAHKKVADTRGRTALERGPLVYCAEAADNGGNVFNLLIPDDAALHSEYKPNLLGGVAIVSGNVVALSRGKDKISIEKNPCEFVAIPYYAWANRTAGQMAVWLAKEKGRIFLPPVPTIASTSHATCSCGKGTVEDNYPGGKVPTVAERFYPSSQSGCSDISAIYDQIEPVNSADGSCPYLRLRPRQKDSAWVQYTFAKKTKVSSVQVYWKDDKEYCLLPKFWRVVYWDAGQWKPVKNHQPYKVERDRFNRITFEPVDTERLRLEIQFSGQKFEKGQLGPPDANYLKYTTVWYECGIIEWQVE